MVLDLIHEGYQVFPLMGNHEQMVLQDYESLEDLIFYPDGVPENKEGLKYVFQEYIDFFYNLPYYYQIEDFILVHAGFDIYAENPFDNFEAMLWQRNFDDAGNISQRIIHGHDSTYLPIIEAAINDDEQIINIDNGVTSSKWEKGHLLCLNLQTLHLYKKACLDKK